MRVLELFAGSRSIGKAATELGMEVLSTDITQYGGIDVVGDILSIPTGRWKRFKPDVIWASPPCTGFSVASIGSHWAGGREAYLPKSVTAALGMALVLQTQKIISLCEPQHWFMENPRGVLRKMHFMQGYGTRHTVSYCQYGDERMKPTDIWTNSDSWKPKPMCQNGDTCHVAAPRGAKTGTQGRNGAHERGKIPHELCLEILRSCL